MIIITVHFPKAAGAIFHPPQGDFRSGFRTLVQAPLTRTSGKKTHAGPPVFFRFGKNRLFSAPFWALFGKNACANPCLLFARSPKIICTVPTKDAVLLCAQSAVFPVDFLPFYGMLSHKLKCKQFVNMEGFSYFYQKTVTVFGYCVTPAGAVLPVPLVPFSCKKRQKSSPHGLHVVPKAVYARTRIARAGVSRILGEKAESDLPITTCRASPRGAPFDFLPLILYRAYQDTSSKLVSSRSVAIASSSRWSVGST